MFAGVATILSVSSGTASQTFTTKRLKLKGAPLSGADVFYSFFKAGYTGGSTDTSILWRLETSDDGTTWFKVTEGTTNNSNTTLDGGGATTKLLRYIRGKCTVSGTAPTTYTASAVIAGTIPFEVEDV